MQLESILTLVGLALFALSVLVFRRSEGTPAPIWTRGSGRSRIGLAAWWLSLACVCTGLVMVVRPG